MKFLDTLKAVVAQIGVVGKTVWDAVIPAAGILVACDLLIGTNFGVMARLSALLGSFGITGNALTIIFIIAVYQIFKKS